MSGFRLSGPAKADIVKLLAWTERQFGEAARERYATLITAALLDISSQPAGVGSILRPELGEGVRSWHLSLSRERASPAASKVRKPRHFLIYRMEGNVALIGRILHEAMDLAQHLDAEETWK